MPTEPPSLTPDERALAERLARLGPRAEPSPALDARVLAAARDAVALSPRRRSRWPAALGLAASLVLAVGVAWQIMANATILLLPSIRNLRQRPDTASKHPRPMSLPAAEATD
jgi:hypothetical protein